LLPFEKIKSEKMNRATATPSPFSLNKWYLDCVDTRGNVFIGYSAVLKWKKIRLNYAEKLEMSVKPWKLPLAELRWGRFLSETDTIVWIDWQGEMPVNWVFYQGNPVSQAVVGDDFVSINRGEILLQFSDSWCYGKVP
jgi:hypothetical protein